MDGHAQTATIKVQAKTNVSHPTDSVESDRHADMLSTSNVLKTIILGRLDKNPRSLGSPRWCISSDFSKISAICWTRGDIQYNEPP